MSFHDDSNDSDWFVTPLKKENEKENENQNQNEKENEKLNENLNENLNEKPNEKESVEVKKKPPRPKENRNFCEKWLSIFSPWLSRCEDDPNRPFCRACQRNLDNNRFRLQRHERTAKHARNQEILLNEGEDAVRFNLSRGTKRIKREMTFSMSGMDMETKFDHRFFLKKNMFPKTFKTPIEKIDIDSPYIYAKREFNDVSDYYYTPPPSHHHLPSPQQPMLPKKDSFDLFFEAISASVKALPPKLAAEVKSKVSQVIAEFELRAICEKEAEEKAQQQQQQQQSIITIPTQVANVVTIDPVITTGTNAVATSIGNQQSVGGTTVTQYVYSYQQKKENN